MEGRGRPGRGMESKWARRILIAAASACGLSGAALGMLASSVIYAGANPPAGGGSLGHVGAIIAGLIMAFGALILLLLGVYFYGRTRE